jgi:hypothetical protein
VERNIESDRTARARVEKKREILCIYCDVGWSRVVAIAGFPFSTADGLIANC